MTETFFNETPQENWKNSEVMTAFLDLYQEPVKEAAEEPAELSKIDLEDNFDYEGFMSTQAALGYIQDVLGELNKLSSQAGLNNDGITAYKIERAIDEIKKVRSQIWDPGDE